MNNVLRRVQKSRFLIGIIIAAILLTSVGVVGVLAASPSTVVAYGVINPSGCEVYENRGKLRLDFYLTKDAPYYDNYHRYVPDWESEEAQSGYPGTVDENGDPIDWEDYQSWVDNLPHIWVDTPFHCHILRINDLDMLDVELLGRVKGLLLYFYEFHQHCWSNELAFIEEWTKVPVQEGTAREALIVADNSTVFLHEAKVADIVARAGQFQVILTIAETKTNLNIGERGTIDIGAAATDRSSTVNALTNTLVEASNPANDSGTIDAADVYVASDAGAANFHIGTFSAAGNTLTCRDSENVGNVDVGLNEITGLDIDVVTGDYIGCHCKSGVICTVDRDTSGGTHIWYVAGEYIDPSDSTTFSTHDGSILSLYGTGIEAAAGTPYSWGQVVG